MDKTVLRSFAVESRKKLIEDTIYRLNLLGITEKEIQDPIEADGMQSFQLGNNIFSIYDDDIRKRKEIVKEIRKKGFNNFVEEVSYTWFNRIIAIRYMEVNNYLPTKIRVLSSDTQGKIDPDILTYALDIDLDYSQEDKELIIKLKNEEELDELFRFLFIKQCNKLNDILPGLFEKTDDYMELLLNVKFSDENGIIRQLVDYISEEDFGNQVEIIGWLYQFYNIELKDETFANLKKKIRISKERIPAATQLFTPDWIVKYMVENSLGRLWLENHPNETLKSKWKYFVEEAEQNSDVELEIIKIKKDCSYLKPQDISVIDPCMGSGHALVYIFEVLMQIYTTEGYTEKDASENILRHNLYGLDIDDRAYQLAYFAVLMKAREYNKHIFKKNITPMLFSIKESNTISKEFKEYIISENPKIEEDLDYILNIFQDAKEYGSILNVDKINFDELKESINFLKDNKADLNKFKYNEEFILLNNLVCQAELLSKNYYIVITNPPYMASKGMTDKLKSFLRKNYPMSKSDLFAVFIEKCQNMLKENGFSAMITQQSFMFLSTFEELRFSLTEDTFINMIHLGARAFEEIGGEVVQATSFIRRKSKLDNYNSTFFRLVGLNTQEKEIEFLKNQNKYVISLDLMKTIPGSPIAYWQDEEFLQNFKKGTLLKDKFNILSGITTGNTDKFLKYWWEIPYTTIGFGDSIFDLNLKENYWIPYNKGGNFRKWYGNQDYVVNWRNGSDDKHRGKKNFEHLFLNSHISWSLISGIIGVRYYPKGYLWDITGPSIFEEDEDKNLYLLGFLNSSVCSEFLSIINPTLAFPIDTIGKLPVIYDETQLDQIKSIVKNNICLSKENYEFSEISINFKKNPFLFFENSNIRSSYEDFKELNINSFLAMKNNEERLNDIFCEIYNAKIDIEILDKYISINLADYEKDIKSFISYAVGCMFGRYNLGQEGLQFAGGDFDINKYSKFVPDEDNIIPVLDSEYFEDDIVGRFIEFVKTCFGEEHLEENLDFIADALANNTKPSREKIRDYLLKNFFNDHKRTYKNCPIYWQFSSGKENGFNCLIYMHRYEPSLVARIRTEYLHKTQKAIEQAMDGCDITINHSSSNTEINKATKEKNKLQKQLKEIQEYDEALAHIANQNIEIDLDNGVKFNYAKFQNVEVSRESSKTKTINLLKKL